MTAEEYRLDGDEELAYITYMKYFNMLTAIHKKSDYASHKSTVRQMLGDTESNRRIMDTLEVIMNSLRHRYAQQRQPVEQIGTELVSNGRVSVEAPRSDRNLDPLCRRQREREQPAGSPFSCTPTSLDVRAIR